MFNVSIYFADPSKDDHGYVIADVKKDISVSEGIFTVKYVDENCPEKERYAIYPLDAVETVVIEEL